MLEGLLPYTVNNIIHRFIGTERGVNKAVMRGREADERRRLVPELVYLERRHPEQAITLHRYLQDMANAFVSTRKLLRPGGTLVIVCGDNLIGGRRIRTWKILNAMLGSLAFTLFDTEGVALVNTLKGGSKGLEEMRQEFRALGGVMSKEVIEQAVQVKDETLRLDVAMRGIRNRIALAVLPVLDRFIRFVTRAAAALSKFVEGTHLVELGMIALGIATVVLGRKMILTAVTTLIAWAPMIAMFLLVTVVVGLIILAVDDLLTFFKGGESVIGDFIDALFGIGTAKSVVKEIEFAWEGVFLLIDNAISAIGDFIASTKDAANAAAEFLGLEKPFEENQARARETARRQRQFATTPGTQTIEEARAETFKRTRVGAAQATRRRGPPRTPRTVQTQQAPPLQSVQVPAGATSNQSTVNQNTQNTVTINAASADAREVETRVQRALRRFKDEDNTAALEALVPQGSG